MLQFELFYMLIWCGGRTFTNFVIIEIVTLRCGLKPLAIKLTVMLDVELPTYELELKSKSQITMLTPLKCLNCFWKGFINPHVIIWNHPNTSQDNSKCNANKHLNCVCWLIGHKYNGFNTYYTPILHPPRNVNAIYYKNQIGP